MNLFEEYLCCPIDGASLKSKKKVLKCSLCGRKYFITKKGILDFFTGLRLVKSLSDSESRWRYKSYHIANSDENKRGREGTLFEKIYHRKRIRDYRKIIQDYTSNKRLRILDLGISTGYCEPIFPEDSIRFGVDINMDTLETQKEHISRGESQKMNLIHADIYDLPFKKEIFDLITMFVTFHRLKKDVIQRVSEHLKKDGTLIIGVPSKKGFLWNQKMRHYFWKLGLISNSEGIRESFEFEVRRYSKKDLRTLSIIGLECLDVYNTSWGMELVTVFKKTQG